VKCPFCNHTEDRVVDSRVGRDGEFIRRRRECLKCHRRYTTYEYIEDVLPHVVKRDGRREPFDRQKLRGSILKACEKRSVGVQAVDDMVVEIEAQLHDRAEKEITSEELGKIVMEHLQRLDPVAYVRFASVYRKFKDVGQFVEEVKGLQRDDKAKPAAAAKPKVVAKTK
jgi:transcriptional repressor NrdR